MSESIPQEGTLPKIQIKTVFPDGIPEELKNLQIWINWKKEPDSQTGKIKKLPYQSKFLTRPAMSNNEATWSTYQQAVFSLENENVDGVGIATIEPLIVLDFDHCIDESGILDADVRNTVQRLGTWGEVSQSGTGIHLIGKGTINHDILKGLSKFFEIADKGKFIYVTGNRLNGTPDEIRDITDPLKAVWYEKFKTRFVEKYGEIRRNIPENTRQSDKNGSICDDWNLQVQDIGMPDDPIDRGNGVYQGSHPFHGSETGLNFSVDTRANVWYCFRHRTGGGPLEIFAVREGLIGCEQVGPGCLDGRWSEIFTALEKCGYKKKNLHTCSKSGSAGSATFSGSENPDNIALNNERGKDTPSSSLTQTGGSAWVSVGQRGVSDCNRLVVFNEGARLKAGKDTITGDERFRAVNILLCYTWLKSRSAGRDDAALIATAEFNQKRCNPPLSIDEVSEVTRQAFSILKQNEDTPESTEPDTDERIKRLAYNILKRGKVIEYFKKVFAELHSGDTDVAETMLCSYAAQCALTTMGIQIGLDGQKGAGKTSAIKAALHLHAPEYVLEASFSGKGLFYDKRLRDGCIIYSDESELQGDLSALVKRAMSNFQTGTSHLTVERDKDGKNVSELKSIPKRVCIIFTAVSDTGDDEILDRQYRLSVSPTVEANGKFVEFVKMRMKTGREEYPINRKVMICREITRILKSNLFRVEIPFVDKISFVEINARRDILMYFDFVMACSVIFHMQRETKTSEDGVITVFADREDVKLANSIFKAGEETRRFRLGKDQHALIDWILDHADQAPDLNYRRIEEHRVIQEYGVTKNISRSAIRRLLYGRDGNSGMVNKIPGVYVQQESVYVNKERSTRINMIYVQKELKTSLSDFKEFVKVADPVDPR